MLLIRLIRNKLLYLELARFHSIRVYRWNSLGKILSLKFHSIKSGHSPKLPLLRSFAIGVHLSALHTAVHRSLKLVVAVICDRCRDRIYPRRLIAPGSYLEPARSFASTFQQHWNSPNRASYRIYALKKLLSAYYETSKFSLEVFHEYFGIRDGQQELASKFVNKHCDECKSEDQTYITYCRDQVDIKNSFEFGNSLLKIYLHGLPTKFVYCTESYKYYTFQWQLFNLCSLHIQYTFSFMISFLRLQLTCTHFLNYYRVQRSPVRRMEA